MTPEEYAASIGLSPEDIPHIVERMRQLVIATGDLPMPAVPTAGGISLPDGYVAVLAEDVRVALDIWGDAPYDGDRSGIHAYERLCAAIGREP